MEFAGRACVVTGAASGLGEAFAREAAARGMSIVIADVNEQELERVRASVASAGVPVVPVRCDVSDDKDVDRFAAEVLATVGVPTLVFNNAGVSNRNGLLWETDPADWNWVLGVNVLGVVNGIRGFVPAMLEAAKADGGFRGRIVNVASMGGLFNPALCGVYSASKHAVVSITETLHHDLNIVSPNIACSVVCPFYVTTNIHRSDDARPAQFQRRKPATRSQEIGQEFADSGMASAKLGVREVAAFVFDEIARDQFYSPSSENVAFGEDKNGGHRQHGKSAGALFLQARARRAVAFGAPHLGPIPAR